MNQPHLFQGIEPDTFLTTETFAAKLSLNPQSIRKRYSQTGGYYGVRRSRCATVVFCGPASRSRNCSSAVLHEQL